MRALLIAEKPSLMRAIEEVYRKMSMKDTIDFMSFAGHTMTLKNPDEYKEDWKKWDMAVLPMIPDKFEYKPTKDKLKMYSDLKKAVLSGKYDYVINACDAGREGQHIFHSFFNDTKSKLPVKRIWIRDLTESGLKDALSNLHDDKEDWLRNMTIASHYRAFFDWLIGLNGTRAITLLAGTTIKVGRVMTPTLKMIVDRELELLNFKPKTYYEIKGSFGDSITSYDGLYTNEKRDDGGKFFKKEEAEDIIKSLGSVGTIESVSKKKEQRYAPLLHSLPELQNEANRVYGYTMSETLEIAQSLYEKKIISYPRTDSPYVTTAIASSFSSLLVTAKSFDKLKGITDKVLLDKANISAVAKNKKYVDDSKVSDHYAIVPTGSTVNIKTLSQREQDVLYIICKRLIAIFLPPMVTNKTSIITDCSGHKFTSKGSVLVDKGYTLLYPTKNTDSFLPDVKKGETYPLKNASLDEKKTTPPSRYTDETLGKAMENAGRFVEDKELSDVLKQSKGIGTPATRGSIVEKLVSEKMVERKKKSFHATDFGISIIKSLDGRDITLPELTGVWEDKLSKIEGGSYDPRVFYKEMKEYSARMIEDFKTISVDKKGLPKSTSGGKLESEEIGKCPKCASPVVIGKTFYFCSEYKKSCDFIFGKEMWSAKITKTEAKKLLSKGETKEFEFTWRSGKKSKTTLKIKDGKVVPGFTK